MQVASRYLLPLEMLLACKLILLAVNGGFGGGTMYRALVAQGESLSWFIFVGSIGLPLLVLAVHEWCLLRKAEAHIINASVTARAFFSFLGAMTWLGAAVFIISIGAAPTTMYFMLLAPVAATFHAWCFVENMKVKVALDDRYPTPHLRFRR